MLTPFEEKSALAGLLDRIGLRALFFLLSILWFYRLWRFGSGARCARGRTRFARGWAACSRWRTSPC